MAGHGRENGQTILMHRQIMPPPPGMVVDHIDANRGNNCRGNLRVCTRRENQQNKRKERGAWSRFKGVSFDKRYGYGYARCRLAGRYWSLGTFANEAEAGRAYDQAAVAWFGPFARVNFPGEWPPERRQKVYDEAQAERAAPSAKVAAAQRRRGKAGKGRSKESVRQRWRG